MPCAKTLACEDAVGWQGHHPAVNLGKRLPPPSANTLYRKAVRSCSIQNWPQQATACNTWLNLEDIAWCFNPKLSSLQIVAFMVLSILASLMAINVIGFAAGGAACDSNERDCYCWGSYSEWCEDDIPNSVRRIMTLWVVTMGGLVLWAGTMGGLALWASIMGGLHGFVGGHHGRAGFVGGHPGRAGLMGGLHHVIKCQCWDWTNLCHTTSKRNIRGNGCEAFHWKAAC